jgi:hypothetical protein
VAANPARRSRRMGSTRKVVCSHTPVRTRGSAISRITAMRPPTKSESGFLNTRHETESGHTSAASPAGCEKSREGRSTGSNNTRVAASKLFCNGQGRTIGVVTVTKPSQSLPATGFLCGWLIEFSCALLEYRFEFTFERSRRNSELAKSRRVI